MLQSVFAVRSVLRRSSAGETRTLEGKESLREGRGTSVLVSREKSTDLLLGSSKIETGVSRVALVDSAMGRFSLLAGTAGRLSVERSLGFGTA